MSYPLPDKSKIDSKSSGTTTKKIPLGAIGLVNGVYESTETTSDDSLLGIAQIIVTRTVNNGELTVEIREATDLELQAYLTQVELDTQATLEINN